MQTGSAENHLVASNEALYCKPSSPTGDATLKCDRASQCKKPQHLLMALRFIFLAELFTPNQFLPWNQALITTIFFHNVALSYIDNMASLTEKMKRYKFWHKEEHGFG